MTKRHFEAFAREIRNPSRPIEERWAAAFVVLRVARKFNPRFDRSRFLKACGLEN